jgi:uncharacterized protein
MIMPSLTFIGLLSGLLRFRSRRENAIAYSPTAEQLTTSNSGQQTRGKGRPRIHICKKGTEGKSGAVPKEWIISGAPIAHSAVLSRSADSTATAFLWDCTAGTFNWHYETDEMIFILEGAVNISAPELGHVNLGPGDTVYFPAGTKAVWTVHNYIKKVAFCRHPMRMPVGLALIAISTLKRRFNTLVTRPVKPTIVLAVYSLSYLA